MKKQKAKQTHIQSPIQTYIKIYFTAIYFIYILKNSQEKQI